MCAVKVQKMELGEPDESGRRRPVPIEGAIEEIPARRNLGYRYQTPTPSQKKIGGKMELNKWGYIVATRRPARPPIPASGPAATSSPVPLRSFWRCAGKKAAASITKSLLGE